MNETIGVDGTIGNWYIVNICQTSLAPSSVTWLEIGAGLPFQVKAIAEKIRQYYSLKERNTLDDVDDVSVLQIGRFLQYLK